MSDGHSHVSITVKYVFIFLQIIVRSQKKLMWDSIKPWN